MKMRWLLIRASMHCAKKQLAWRIKQYSLDYLDPDKRSIANAVQVFFKDGSRTEKIEVEYPLGHRRRRQKVSPCWKPNSRLIWRIVFRSGSPERSLL